MDQVGLAARARRHWLFGLVLVAALVLRILVALAFRPIMWFGGDSASYLATGLRLIPDPSRVGGYGFMLWVLRPLHSFALVAAVQHLMGLAMGVLIYLLARRFGLPAWAATLATLPVLFDAYELQLESDAVPDVPFGFLVLLALYLLLRSPGERRPAATAAAAFLLGVSALLWPVGLVLLAVLLVVLLAALLIRRAGLVTVLAALLAGALPVAAYAAWFSIHEQQFSLTRSDGVYLWSRTMLFADCAVIRPPAGERALCPPPGPRMAASLYIWDGNSPLLATARRAVLGPDQPARAALRAAGHRGAAGRLCRRGRARLQPELLLGPAGPPGRRDRGPVPVRRRGHGLGAGRACAPRAAGRWPATRPRTTTAVRRRPAWCSRTPPGW